jgi:DNA-binding LacI/PurR family transcriptional regulator
MIMVVKSSISRKKAKGHLSIADAAAQLGVSTALISMVLNDRWRENRISPATCQRVLKQLESIDFRPNRLARSLRNYRTGAIGVLVPNIRSEFYQSILNGIESVMGDEFLPTLGVSEHNPAKEHRLIVSFLEHRMDGLILVLTGEDKVDPLLGEIRRKQIPMVLIDRDHTKIPVSFVGSNHRKAGEMAATHLIDAGYPRCAFMAHAHTDAAQSAMVAARLEGFEAVMRRHGVPFTVVQEIVSGDAADFKAAGERFLATALAHQPSPVGLFAMHPVAAAGVLLSCRQSGLKVPDEVGVLTSDGFVFNELLATPLSTIHQPTQRIGQIAALMLHDMIEGRVSPQAVQRAELDVELVPCASTALRQFSTKGRPAN